MCFTCGTKMRPAGSCYVCEGCGAHQRLQLMQMVTEMSVHDLRVVHEMSAVVNEMPPVDQ